MNEFLFAGIIISLFALRHWYDRIERRRLRRAVPFGGMDMRTAARLLMEAAEADEERMMLPTVRASR